MGVVQTLPRKGSSVKRIWSPIEKRAPNATAWLVLTLARTLKRGFSKSMPPKRSMVRSTVIRVLMLWVKKSHAVWIKCQALSLPLLFTTTG